MAVGVRAIVEGCRAAAAEFAGVVVGGIAESVHPTARPTMATKNKTASNGLFIVSAFRFVELE
jgi:hypothetical protein